MKPRWRLMLFLAVLLCVLLTQAGRPHVIKRRLADGSTLSLVRITHGTDHRYVHGWFRSVFFSVLPHWARGEMGQGWDSVTTQAECDVAWFVLDPPSGGRTPNSLNIDSTTLFDEHGCEIRNSTMSDMFAQIAGSRGRRISGVILSPLPRRAQTAGVRFWARVFNQPSIPVADFPVAMPPAAEIPKWTPNPVPFTVSAGAAKCELLSLLTGQPYTSGLAAPNERNTIAVIRMHPAANDREPVWVRYRDAAGEVMDHSPHIVAQRLGGSYLMRSMGSLWPHEPAYDVEVALSRTKHAAFENAELHTVSGLAVPPASQAKRAYRDFPKPQKLQMGDQEVEVSSPDWSFRGPPALFLHFYVKGQAWPLSRIVVTRVQNDQGREIEVEKDGYVRYTPFFREGRLDTSVDLPVLIKKPAKSLTVTFALDRPEVVRFRVKPEQWQPSAKAGKP